MRDTPRTDGAVEARESRPEPDLSPSSFLSPSFALDDGDADADVDADGRFGADLGGAFVGVPVAFGCEGGFECDAADDAVPKGFECTAAGIVVAATAAAIAFG